MAKLETGVANSWFKIDGKSFQCGSLDYEIKDGRLRIFDRLDRNSSVVNEPLNAIKDSTNTVFANQAAIETWLNANFFFIGKATGGGGGTTITGTANRVPKFNSAGNNVENSNITQVSNRVGINQTNPSVPLDIVGEVMVRPITQYSSNYYGKGLSLRYDTIGGQNYGYLVTYNWDTSSFEEFRFNASRTLFNHGAVAIGTISPSPSCILDLESSTQGLGLTRLSTTQILAMPAPKNGTVLFNITLDCLCVYTNNGWQKVTQTAM